MRLLFVLLSALCLSLPGALAGESARPATTGESPRAASEKQPDLKAAPTGKPHFRCAKKIALGPDKSEVGCLIKKRNANAGPPPASAKPAPSPQREASGRDQDRRPSGRIDDRRSGRR